jgi:hypothetical protein
MDIEPTFIMGLKSPIREDMPAAVTTAPVIIAVFTPLF